jgi:transcriptional regulator with XRE-family HTH domain
MPPRFDASEVALPGGALAILRVVSGWSQKQLAAAAGVNAEQISSYERGRTDPPLAKLQHFVALMGLPPHSLEDALSFLTEERAAAARFRGGGGPDAAVLADIDAIAAGVGRSCRQYARSLLAELIAKAGILEARRQAPVLWARLRRYAAGKRRVLVREVAEFQGWALCELLCDESVKAAADDPKEALGLAELAVELACRTAEPENWRRRLEGYARAFQANAVRAGSKIAAAGEMFARALEVWESGAPADPAPLDANRRLDLEASLRRAQGRLQESLDLLDRGLAEHPSGPAAGRLLLNRAKTLEELDDYAGAVAALREAAPQIDATIDPRLPLVLRHNLAWDLCHLGRAAEAELLLPEVRALAAGAGRRLDLLRLRWLEGLVAAGLGRTREAVAAFEEVRAGFQALNMPYDAALATMQLAAVYLEERGRSAEVKALARQAAPVFEAEGVHAEARKALAVFRRAAEEERATLDLARRLAAYLRRARCAPELAFEAAA